MWVRSLGWEDTLEKGMATHSSILAWRIPWTEEPGRLQSMGSHRVGHNWNDLPHRHSHVIRLIISFATEDGEILYSQQKTRPGVNCGIDHELLTAKFRLKLKKGGETTRPFRYDLNQIPYDYTVEMMNRFKGLVSGRQECPKNYGWKFIKLYQNHL